MARPREFEIDDALNDLMHVFWRQGYEATSMFDIEDATGLNKQSLYRVFGDKRAMYLAALKHYDDTQVRGADVIFDSDDSAHAKFRVLFESALEPVLKRNDRNGCFLCNASADQSQLDDQTQSFVSAAVNRLLSKFSHALSSDARYKTDIALRDATAAQLLAGYFGLRVLVRASADIKTLKRAVHAILSSI
ncbi:MAG: helix-turn-helix domain-containing protein [Pseudomonadota bacterium]